MGLRCNRRLLLACAAALALSACSGTIGDPVDGQAGNAIHGQGGGGTSASASCQGDPNAIGEAPIRRLSHVEYNRTLADLFPGVALPVQTFPEDLRVHGFENNAKAMNPSPVLIERYSAAAEEVAQLVAQNAGNVLPCASADMACGKQIIADVGARAFRRPLTAAEAGRYEAFFAKQMGAISWNGALELTLAALLQAPQFLYRIELGADADGASAGEPVALSDYEMASRLSYFFWQSMPDAELFAAAEAGELQTPKQVEAQARRMLDDERAKIAFADFHRQWLDFDRLLKQNKDPALFPEWNDDVRAAMLQESTLFVQDVFAKGSGTLAELLTSNTTFVNPDLAPIYGVKLSPLAEGFERVDLPAKQRSGLLTQGTFLASRAHTTNGSPPLRGVAVLEALLCDRPPPPPPTANTSAPMQDPAAPRTNRELFEQRTSPSLCQGCHKQINGIGYGFEAYDSIGRFRTEDNGMPVDTSGELVGTDVDGKYDGAVELSHMLSESARVQLCAVRNLYRYAHGRDEGQGESCQLEALDESLGEHGGDLRELMVQIATSHEFMHRPKVTP